MRTSKHPSTTPRRTASKLRTAPPLPTKLRPSSAATSGMAFSTGMFSVAMMGMAACFILKAMHKSPARVMYPLRSILWRSGSSGSQTQKSCALAGDTSMTRLKDFAQPESQRA